MIIDANLLIYAYVVTLDDHRAARAWLVETLSSPDRRVWLPRASIHAFLRLTTKQKLFDDPFSAEEAVRVVDSWLERPNVKVLDPGPGHWLILRDLLLRHDIRGDLIMDAHIAALAIEHDTTIYTADRDFHRFGGLRVVNPLR